MTQAILLVGGMGTRLMPLTRNVPKPMLPVAGLPVTEHQLIKAKRAGITSLVLATSYLADVFTPYFGDGSRWGMKLQYAVEKEPLGTGGAIRNAAQLLDESESVVIFNGDVLSSHDLTKQISMHKELNADVVLHLTHVEDARAYGCVPVGEDGRVAAFLEKMEKPVANTINAGCYVFHPRVIDEIPEGKVVSIEKDVFPELVRKGGAIYGMIDDSYWLDVGTPSALLRGSSDIVRGIADASALEGVGFAHRSSEYVAHEGAVVESGASITGGSSLGKRAYVSAGALIYGSIVGEEARVLEGAKVRNCFVAAKTTISAGADISDSYVSSDEIVSLLPL